MRRATRRQLSKTPALASAVALAFIALAPPSCATGGAGGSDLERLASRQINRPVEHVTNTPPPAGLQLTAIERESNHEAFIPLVAIAQRLADEPLPSRAFGEKAPVEITEEAETNALRRYIAGRSALVGGNVAEAIRQLDAAAALNPVAPEIWRTLADAHWQAGDRLAATAAYLRAIELNEGDVVSLTRVGLSELERRSHRRAAILLAKARRAIERGDTPDAALPSIVGVALGRSLHELGWLRAGADAIVEALEETPSLSQPTTFRRELSALIRTAGDAWRDAGDLRMRLGQPEAALDAYNRAASMPSFDPAALLTRRVYALMKLGRPAEAALLLTQRIEELDGLVDDRTLRLIEYVARVSDVGPALAANLQRAEQSLTPDQRRVASSQLVRARAAALPVEAATRVLIDRLATAPADEAAVSDLLNLRDPEDAPGLVSLVARLIEANTIESQRYAAALMRYTPESDDLLDAADSLEGPRVGAALLTAAIADAIGEFDRAESSLERAVAIRPQDPGVRLAQARLAIDRGKRDRALGILDTIDPGSSRSAALAVARALRRLGENGRALTILEERVWSGEATAEEALAAGEISLALERPVDAEQLFRLAMELDPSLEQAYAGLISLYQSGGALENQANLSDTLRSLRESIPSSQTLRWLRAQDLIRADRLDQAQRELESLAEETLDARVIERLISVWLRTGSSETAMEWLSRQRERRPTHGAPVRMLARVQAARGETDEAITSLEAWLERFPHDTEASREYERVLRLESVGRTEDADRVALDRLSRATPSLRRSLELAPIYVRQDRTLDAIESLEQPMTRGFPIERSLLNEYAQLIAGVATHAARNEPADTDAPARGVALLQRFLNQFPESPPGMHRGLLDLMVRTGADADQIAQAAIDAGRAHPEAPDDFALEALQRLIRIDKMGAALNVAEISVKELESPSARMFAMWLALAGDQQDADAATEALRTIDRARMARETAAALNDLLSGAAPAPEGDEDESLAELTYFTAMSFVGDEHERTREELYELAIEHNPRHAMALNNLAYGWTERGENLDRAHEMLITAHAEEPGSDAITDSLGWVRYKLGMIDDQRDAEGRVVLQGAVTLLTSAAKLSDGRDGAFEILDHLGDALWRAGHPDRAIDSWRRARAILRNTLDNPNLAERFRESLRTLQTSIDAKLTAAADGEFPPLEPMARPRQWTQEAPAEDRGERGQIQREGAPL